MNSVSTDYNLFLKFFNSYSQSGFKHINPADPLMLDLEAMMEKNNQFFYVADLLQIQVLYTSKRSKDMMGVDPAILNPYHFFQATHPDDLSRLSLGRAQLFKMANDLFMAQEGTALLSTNFRIRNAEGAYANILVQLYLFFTELPYKTVFTLKIHTNIDWFKKPTHGYHYYLGNDLSYFKYPDEQLLLTGSMLSDREFEILRLIEKGSSSEQIADYLFISLHTVNTHRKNILRKTGKTNISDVIYDLLESGVL
ncbi:MAG: helix-turn-helix transcriptional regulator [Saprospiraceae bacterium]|nr:helix-turn-helix transcriptional regulator [Saprospiraceae bacterium]